MLLFRREKKSSNTRYVEGEAKSENHSIVYLATDHLGLYEKYGYIYLETRKDYWDEETRIYYKNL